MLNNAKSRELKEYSQKDFSDISAISLEHITKYTTEIVKKQREELKLAKTVEKRTSLAKDNFYVEEDSFYQIWEVKLNKNSKQNVLDSIKVLEKRDDIMMAFPNYYTKCCATVSKITTTDETVKLNVSATRTPNDSNISQQWAIDKIDLTEAWNITTGSSSVNVGIIDTGIMGNHPDLTNRVNRTLSEDFTGGNSPLTDPNGHGTHVAGIIGAQGNNSIGISGVCWNVGLVSLKAAIYSSDEKSYIVSYSKFAKAIDYAQAQRIPIVSISYSGKGYESRYFNVIDSYDGLFICSAGNDGENINDNNKYVYTSCNTKNMISVANSTNSDLLYTGSDGPSNYSSKYVHLAAPGTNIYSTYNNGQYVSLTGTSMATPYVAGVAALLKSKYPDFNYTGLKYYITNKVDVDTDKFEGKVSSKGRLNAYKALSAVTQYTVEYNANGGTGTMDDTPIIYGNHTSLRTNQFSNNGLPFKGWYAKRSSDDKWYYTNGSNGRWYKEGTQPTGYYKFLYSDGHNTYNATSVNGDTVTMYAQWIDIQYTVTFNGNGGIGSMQNKTVQYGVPTALPNNSFTRNGCTFDFWYAKNENGQVYCSKQGGYYGWHLISQREDGYSTKLIFDGSDIHLLENVADGNTVTMYAYWLPNSGELGDIDNNESIDISDVTIIQKYSAGSSDITLSSDAMIRADVNFDGQVNINDASAIQKYIAGVIDIFA